MRAGLDDQLRDGHVAVDPAAGDDLEPLGVDPALEAPADEHLAGIEVALDPALFADRHLRFAVDGALELAVDVQVVAQGEVADKLCTWCNDGRSGALAAVRTISVNDSH